MAAVSASAALSAAAEAAVVAAGDVAVVELSDDLKLIETRDDYQLQESKVGDGVVVASLAHGFQELAWGCAVAHVSRQPGLEQRSELDAYC